MSFHDPGTVYKNATTGESVHRPKTVLNPRQHSVPPIETLGAPLHLTEIVKSHESSRSSSVSASTSDIHTQPQPRILSPAESGSTSNKNSQPNTLMSSQGSERQPRSTSAEPMATEARTHRLGQKEVASPPTPSNLNANHSYDGNPYNNIRDLLVPLIVKNAQLRDVIVAPGQQGEAQADQVASRVRELLSDEKCRDFMALAQSYKNQTTGQSNRPNVKMDSSNLELSSLPLNPEILEKLPGLLASIKQLSSQHQHQEQEEQSFFGEMRGSGATFQASNLPVPREFYDSPSQRTSFEPAPAHSVSKIDSRLTTPQAPDNDSTNTVLENTSPDHGSDLPSQTMIELLDEQQNASQIDDTFGLVPDQPSGAQATVSGTRTLALNDDAFLSLPMLMSDTINDNAQMNGERVPELYTIRALPLHVEARRILKRMSISLTRAPFVFSIRFGYSCGRSASGRTPVSYT
jgi:hypothetical protein